MERSFTSSISRIIEGTGKLVGNTIDDVLDVVKNVPTGALTADAASVFENLPASAFAKRGEFVTTATGRDLSTWSRLWRGADDIGFDTALRDIGLSPGAFDTAPLKNLNRASFPEADILAVDNVRTVDKVTIGTPATNSLDGLSSNQIDELAGAAENDNAISSIWQKAKKAGTITLVTGAVIVVGVVASQFITDAVALNSGCFLAVKTANGTTWRRIIGYTCGDSHGDELWLAKSLPTSPHPLAKYMPTNPCSGYTGCKHYCEPENFDTTLAAHISEIPATQTLICRSASISDVLSDLSNDLGTSLGNIVGGVTGGVVGGIAGGLGINTSFVWIILGIAIVLIFGILIFKAVGARKS